MREIIMPGQKAGWNREELKRSHLTSNLINEYGEGPFEVLGLGDDQNGKDFTERFISLKNDKEKTFKIQGRFLLPA